MIRPRGWADLFWANDYIFITTSHQYIFCTDHRVDRTCGIANKNPSCLTEVDPVEASIQRSSFCRSFRVFGSFSVPKVLPFLKGVALERLKCPEEVGGTWPRKLQVAACCYVWTFFSFTLPHFLYNLCNKSDKPELVAWDLLSIYVLALAMMTKMLDALQTFKVKLNEDPIESMYGIGIGTFT